MLELTVGLADRSYPVIIGESVIDMVGNYLSQHRIGLKYCVITDDKVDHLYGEHLGKSLAGANISYEIISFKNGEKQKDLNTVAKLASKMARLGFDRNDAVIAFGGGVPGDIAGFVASSYMRGIPFVQVPTTLLSQVDSSVGGKTGVDIPEGKNLVGAFYQPEAVFIDTGVLKTLEHNEVLGGLAEVLKYGVIRDRAFFDFLDGNREKILALDGRFIEELIYTCCKIKADVVSEDERESNIRRILNYGHTIGHAVEGASDFTLIHGLAVAIGMVAANKIAVDAGVLDVSEAKRIERVLQEYGLPTMIPANMDREIIKKYLLTDKKTVSGKIVFILPQEIGKTTITDQVTHTQIERAIA